MLKPLQIVNKTDGPAKLFWTLLGGSVSEFQTSSLLEYFTSESIAGISLKKRYAFLHVIEDVLRVFDEFHVRPFLDLLMGCVVRLLGSCASSLDNARLNEFPSDQRDSGTDSFPQKEDVTTVNKIQVMFDHYLFLLFKCFDHYQCRILLIWNFTQLTLITNE